LMWSADVELAYALTSAHMRSYFLQYACRFALCTILHHICMTCPLLEAHMEAYCEDLISSRWHSVKAHMEPKMGHAMLVTKLVAKANLSHPSIGWPRRPRGILLNTAAIAVC
jgi:hypothetical protein